MGFTLLPLPYTTYRLVSIYLCVYRTLRISRNCKILYEGTRNHRNRTEWNEPRSIISVTQSHVVYCERQTERERQNRENTEWFLRLILSHSSSLHFVRCCGFHLWCFTSYENYNFSIKVSKREPFWMIYRAQAQMTFRAKKNQEKKFCFRSNRYTLVVAIA